jgi:hypothetical protein
MKDEAKNRSDRGQRHLSAAELAPPDYYDPVIEAYKKDVDRTLLRENLKLTVEERFQKFQSFALFANELREAGRRARAADSSHRTEFS